MFRLIKKVFCTLLSFSGKLATAANAFNLPICIFLNNQPYMTRPTLILNLRNAIKVCISFNL